MLFVAIVCVKRRKKRSNQQSAPTDADELNSALIVHGTSNGRPVERHTSIDRSDTDRRVSIDDESDALKQEANKALSEWYLNNINSPPAAAASDSNSLKSIASATFRSQVRD